MADEKSTPPADTEPFASDASTDARNDAAKVSDQAKKLYEACASGKHIPSTH